MEVTQQCPRCEGSGHVPVPESYLETYLWLRRRRSATAYDVAEALEITHHAACNRLVWLLEYGLAWRSGSGNGNDPYIWRAKRPKYGQMGIQGRPRVDR